MAKGNTIADALTSEQKAHLEGNTKVNESSENRTFNRPRYHLQRVENKINGIPESATRYPEHFVKIALILKNNAEIRRYTSLGIINYLKQKNLISADAKAHVEFKWTKFAVSSEGLITEYSFKEHFFVNCFVASFTSFANSAQQTISEFVEKEVPDYTAELSKED